MKSLSTIQVLAQTLARLFARGTRARAVARCLWYGGAALLVLVAVLFTLLRLWMPNVGEWRPEIETYLTEKSGRPVRIERLDAYWKGLQPGLRARGLSLYAADGRHAVVRLDEARISIAWLRLLTGELAFDELTLVRPALQAQRLKDGRLVFGDLDPARLQQDAGNGTFLRWVLRQSEIRIQDGQLQWHDLKAGEPVLQLARINVSLRNDGKHHELGGTAELPERICKDVRIAADIEGTPFVDADWKGRVYLHAVEFNVRELPAVLLERLPPRTYGRMSAQIWTDWAGGLPVMAEGYVAVADLEVPAPGLKTPFRAKSAQGTLKWQTNAQGWRLEGSDVAFWLSDRPWPVGRLEVEKNADGAVVQVGSVRLDEVAPLARQVASDNPLFGVLQELRPAGELRGLKLSITGDWASPGEFALETELVNGAVQPYRKFPGVTGLSGRLTLTHDGGRMLVDSHDATVDLPELFRAALPVSRASGKLSWTKRDDHWEVVGEDLRLANEDANGTGELLVRVPLDRSLSPYLKLRVDFRDGNGAHAARYYPAKILPPKVLQWLERSIVSGRVTGGHLVYDGNVREYPFGDGRGKFELLAHVRSAVLDYTPGWPRVEDAEADLLFDRAEMLITGTKGRLHGLDLSKVVVQIPDLRSPERLLKIRGGLAGPFNEVVRFLQNGPLSEGNKMAGLGITGTGAGALDLSIEVPLNNPKSTTVAGRYEFRDSDLDLARGLSLSGLRGSVEFTESRVHSAPISGRLLGGETVFTVSTPKPGRPPVMVIDATGQVQAAALRDLLGEQFGAHAEGATAWKGRVQVQKDAAELRIESDLKGIAVKLPAPLDKTAETGLPSTLIFSPRGADDRHLAFRLGNRANGELLFRRQGAQWSLAQGNVAVGQVEANLPNAPGLMLSLRLGQLDLDRWLTEFKTRQQGVPAVPEIVTRVRGAVDNLDVLGRRRGRVEVDLARRAPAHWAGTVRSDLADGKVDFTWGKSDKRVSLDLERLTWPKRPPGADRDTQDPRELPALNVTARVFQYGDMALGQLHLEGRPTARGFNIHRFRLERPEAAASGSGEWSFVDNRHDTRFDAQFSSTDMGETLRAVGYPGQMESGGTEIKGRLQWRGSPGDFAVRNLDAVLDLETKRGRFLKLDPGAGRFLGLLNVDALTRRLVLDFSDIFARGFAFDQIKGRIQIDNGNAYTRELALSGPSADIELSGRAGIVAEDYDLQLVVIPQVAGNLALAGGILGSPATGAAIFLAQKLLKKQIANFIRYQYVITGPWENPNIVKQQSPTTRP